MVSIPTSVNGRSVELDIDGPEAAVDVIREQLGLTGTKLVCAGGVCGACTIQIDGAPVASCLTPATALRDADVTTVEGLGDVLPTACMPCSERFLAHDGLAVWVLHAGVPRGSTLPHSSTVWRSRARGHGARSTHDRRCARRPSLPLCARTRASTEPSRPTCRGEHDGADESAVAAGSTAAAKVTGEAVYTADRYPDGVLRCRDRAIPDRSRQVVAPTAGRRRAEYLVDLLGRRPHACAGPVSRSRPSPPTRSRRPDMPGGTTLPLDIEPRPFVVRPGRCRCRRRPARLREPGRTQVRPGNAAEGPIAPARWSRQPARARTRHRSWARSPSGVIRQGAEGRQMLAVWSNSTVGTSPQLHTSFEPHCTVADWSAIPNRLRRSGRVPRRSTTSTHELRRAVRSRCRTIGSRSNRGLRRWWVRRRSSAVTVDMTAAIELSRRARRPVRLDTRSSRRADGHREPAGQLEHRHRVARHRRRRHGGRWSSTPTATAGTADEWPLRRCCACSSMTARPAWPDDSDIVTNAPPGSPFRGPGGPTYAFALESGGRPGWPISIDRDPIELRQTVGRQRASRLALYDWASESGRLARRVRPAGSAATGRFRRGVGFAAGNWLYMVDPDTEVVVSVEHVADWSSTTATRRTWGPVRRRCWRERLPGSSSIDPLDVDRADLGVAPDEWPSSRPDIGR